MLCTRSQSSWFSEGWVQRVHFPSLTQTRYTEKFYFSSHNTALFRRLLKGSIRGLFRLAYCVPVDAFKTAETPLPVRGEFSYCEIFYWNIYWYWLSYRYPDNKVHGANMGPIWVLSAPNGPHVSPWTLLSGYRCSDSRTVSAASNCKAVGV